MSCGQASSIRKPGSSWPQEKPTHLVAETLEISRSSLYHRPQPRSLRADRRDDQRIVEVCGETSLASATRRVQWWLKLMPDGPCVNRKRVLRVMRERGLLLRSRRFASRAEKTQARWKHRILTFSGSPT